MIYVCVYIYNNIKIPSPSRFSLSLLSTSDERLSEDFELLEDDAEKVFFSICLRLRTFEIFKMANNM